MSSTYLDLYTAQRQAASFAYGTTTSGRPAFTEAFGKLLVDGWVAMAEQATKSGLVPSGDPQTLPGYATLKAYQTGAGGGLTGWIQDALGQSGFADHSDDIWQSVATLAGYMAYYQMPNDLAALGADISDAASRGGAFLEDKMLQVAKAAGAGAISVIFIAAALGIGYLLLMRKVAP